MSTSWLFLPRVRQRTPCVAQTSNPTTDAQLKLLLFKFLFLRLGSERRLVVSSRVFFVAATHARMHRVDITFSYIFIIHIINMNSAIVLHALLALKPLSLLLYRHLHPRYILGRTDIPKFVCQRSISSSSPSASHRRSGIFFPRTARHVVTICISFIDAICLIAVTCFLQRSPRTYAVTLGVALFVRFVCPP